jgi:hypothetical protein
MRRVVEQYIEEELVNIHHFDHPHKAVQKATLENDGKGLLALVDPRQSFYYVNFNLSAGLAVFFCNIMHSELRNDYVSDHSENVGFQNGRNAVRVKSKVSDESCGLDD